MCGIVGFTGAQQAAPILLEGLKRLEYRGYDSAGIAVQDDGRISTFKCSGLLENLYKLTDSGKNVYGVCGIGHTRWATHGDERTSPYVKRRALCRRAQRHNRKLCRAS